MATVSELLLTGVEHHQAGRLDAAAAVYQQILLAEPDHSDALFLLGVMALQAGQYPAAIEYLSQVIQRDPNRPKIHKTLGDAYQAMGRTLEAVDCYQRALHLKPDYADAQMNLGNALNELRRPGEAVDCFRRAVEFKPDFIEAHVNLGNTLKAIGRLDEAVKCYRRTLELKPDFVVAHLNLGIALREQGQLDEAVKTFRQALDLNPNFAEAHNNLGIAFSEQKKLDEAVTCYKRALELKPDDVEAHNNLGNALHDQGLLDKAIDCYRCALKFNPDFAKAHTNLGNSLKSQGKFDEAVACFRRTIELTPEDSEAYNNLGAALKSQGLLDEAVACCRQSIAMNANNADAYNNLGNALKDQGKLSEAIGCYCNAVELKPDFASAHSNLVYTQLFCPGYGEAALFEQHRQWNQKQAAKLARFIPPHLNDRAPDRRLRVGYVSPDFRNHVVGRNLIPLFRGHDHQQFEIHCYADVPSPDEMTNRFRDYADVWHNATGLTDEQLAKAILADGIDILVDLTLHMAQNRLLVFARKPAPVQVTFAGYPGTTGLETIDYRLTDPYLDPPNRNDAIYSEQSIRLPDSFWCYDPLDREPTVNLAPSIGKDFVTFGCLNNFCKVNAPILTLWSRVLKAVDRSRIVILAGAGSHRQETMHRLEAEGINPDRVSFVSNLPRQQYLKQYHEIDIGLDTVPYNGHTTSMDSYWMGVPVVTFVGSTVTGRAGLCQLMNLGLPELIARNEEQYVQIAVDLANDPQRLGDLRATLRERMQTSPLMDAPRFASGIEAAYRTMWQRWCKS